MKRSVLSGLTASALSLLVDADPSESDRGVVNAPTSRQYRRYTPHRRGTQRKEQIVAARRKLHPMRDDSRTRRHWVVGRVVRRQHAGTGVDRNSSRVRLFWSSAISQFPSGEMSIDATYAYPTAPPPFSTLSAPVLELIANA